MKFQILLLSIFFIAHSAHGKNGSAMKDFTASMREFTGYLFHSVKEPTDDNDNIFFSPISIAEALGMVMAGAQGETRDQIIRALCLKDSYSQRNFNNQFRKMYQRVFNMTKLHTASQALLASRAYIQNSYPVRSDYVEILQHYYGTEIERISFDQPAAVETINNWVSEQTQHMIPELLQPDSVDSMTRLMLVNALYFQAQWKKQFNRKGYQDRIFYTPFGQKRVPFMGTREPMQYKTEREVTYIRIPYQNEEAYMVIAMPDQGNRRFTEYQGIIDFFTTFDTTKGWRLTLSPRQQFSMPMFEFDQALDMKEILRSMNVKHLFDESKANLLGISDAENLYVSNFNHMAKITVNEQGTKAAAATSVGISGRSSAMRNIEINRPFVFAIYRVDQVLFAGRVSDPAPSMPLV